VLETLTKYRIGSVHNILENTVEHKIDKCTVKALKHAVLVVDENNHSLSYWHRLCIVIHQKAPPAALYRIHSLWVVGESSIKVLILMAMIFTVPLN
jgi:hypothetical protein